MDDVADTITTILKKHMRAADATITLDTPLSSLAIASLDLAMIVFDIEDAFGIEIPYNADEMTTTFNTVGAVVEKVRTLVPKRAARPSGPANFAGI
jgi:nodulation protein F